MKVHAHKIGFWLSLGLTLSPLACAKKKSKEAGTAAGGTRAFVSQDVITFANIPELGSQALTIRDDLKDLFCIHSYKLPLKSNFDYELGHLCKDNKPTDAFKDIDRHAKLVGDAPRAVKLELSHKEGGITEGMFVTVYKIPIEPKWVKTAHIQDYMTKDSVYDYVTLDADVSKDLNDQVGGDLQFSKYNLHYVTEVTTPDNTTFSNERTTELNSYQVFGGNSDIGLGAEHLVDSPEGKYEIYNTITLTIGDAEGGSHLITIIHIAVKNNGYPELTEKVMSDIARAQASHVHDGIVSELQSYSK